METIETQDIIDVIQTAQRFSKEKRRAKGSRVHDDETVFERELNSWWYRIIGFLSDPIWLKAIAILIISHTMVFCLESSVPISIMGDKYHTLSPEVMLIFNFYILVEVLMCSMAILALKLGFLVPNRNIRSWIFVLIEFLSLIPYELLVFPVNDQKYSNLVFFALRLRVLVPLGSLVYYSFKNDRIMSHSVSSRIFELVLTSFTMEFIVGTLLYNFLYQRDLKSFNPFGIYQNLLNVDQIDLPYAINIYALNFAKTMVIVNPYVSILTGALIFRYYARYFYMTQLRVYEDHLVPTYKINNEDSYIIRQYLKCSWQRRSDYIFFEEAQHEHLLHFSLKQEMKLDRNLLALKHCPLFSDMNLPVLRYLASLFECKLYTEGKYLYKKGQLRDTLYYIAKGEVEALSHENTSSGIITFTTGTCIGLSTLIIPYEAHTDLKTKIPCELHKITRKVFVKFFNKFPKEYQVIKSYVDKKYSIAVKLRTQKVRRSDDLPPKTIIWVKQQLHKFLDVGENDLKRKVSNIFMMEDLQVGVQFERFFTKSDLRFLVLKARDVASDLTFIKSRCLWILKPFSPVQSTLWNIVLFADITMCIFVPFKIAFRPSNSFIYWAIGVTKGIQIFHVLVQIITPPNESFRSTNVLIIIAARCRTIGFVSDVISLLPFTVFYTAGVITRRYADLAELVQLLRIWRIVVTLRRKEREALKRHIFWHISQFVCFYLYALYLFSCLRVFWKKCSVDVCVYQATLLTVGAGISTKEENLASTIGIFLQIFRLLKNVLAADIAAVYNLHKISEYTLKRFARLLNHYRKMFCAEKKCDLSLEIRMNSYLTMTINNYSNFVADSHLQHFPTYLESMIKYKVYSNLINSIFFKLYPEDLRRELALKSRMQMFAQHAIILARGIAYKHIHILLEGAVSSVEITTIKRVQVGSDLNLLEVVFGIPNVRTIVAHSTAKVLVLRYESFMEVLKKYPVYKNQYLNILQESDLTIRPKVIDIFNSKPISRVFVRRKRKIHNLYSFKCIIYRNTLMEQEYFTPFDKLKVCSIVRLLLLRVTFHPDGPVWMFWERIRFVSACLSTVFFCTPNVIYYEYWMILVPLDILALIDIYLRLHVCYYNEKGVLVTHPLYTAKNYITHALVTDVFSCIPLHLTTHDSSLQSLFRFLHLIQIYRIVGYRNYSMNCQYFVTLFHVVHRFCLFITVLSTIVFEVDCIVSHDSLHKCRTLNGTRPTLDYLNVMFLVTSLTTTVNLKSTLEISSFGTMVISLLSIIAILSIFLRAFALAHTLCSFTQMDFRRYSYRNSGRSLLDYMRRYQVPKIMQNYVTEYYQTHWDWFGRESVFEASKHMSWGLRRDVIFSFFGDVFIRFTTFTGNTWKLAHFFKNLFLNVRCEVCATGGKFVSLNDVTDDVFLLVKGEIELRYDENEEEIITNLHEGSIFGNVHSHHARRQRFTAVAKCNTQCLALNSKTFFNIIQYYPHIFREFRTKVPLGRCFLNSMDLKSHQHLFTDAPTNILVKHQVQRYLELIQLIVVCYMGTILNLYQMAVNEVNVNFLIVLYMLDILHVLALLAKIVCPVRDSYGYWIVHFKIVGVKMGVLDLVVGIISAIPFEIFCIFMVVSSGKSLRDDYVYIYSLLRLNRLLRIYYIIGDYIKRRRNVVNVHIFLPRFGFILYECFLSVTTMATLFATFDVLLSHLDAKNHLLLDTNVAKVTELRLLTSREKFRFFIDYSVFSLMIHVHHGDMFKTPANSFMQILTILAMIYSLVFFITVVCQLYDMVMDHTINRQTYRNTIMFLDNLKSSQAYSDYMKTKMSSLTNFLYYSRRKLDDGLLSENCPIYVKEFTLNYVYGFLITSNPIFYHCHPDFLRQLVRHLNIMQYPSHAHVALKNDGRKCMYFIFRGTVLMMENDLAVTTQYLYKLFRGDCFRFLEGLNKSVEEQFTYTCSTDCEIVELEYDTWKYLLEYFPVCKNIIDKTSDALSTEPFLALL